jgi:hypothetical protein
VKRVTIGGWGKTVRCGEGHSVELFFTLPDYGDAPVLYQCPVSGDVFAVSRDAEQYVGPSWDALRETGACPECDTPLALAWAYPRTFRCPVDGLENHVELQIDRYPPDEERRHLDCWDPYG